MDYREQVTKAADFIRSRLEQDQPASVGVVLGTGLGSWVSRLGDTVSIPYALIPGFPRSTVQSHAGALHLGRVSGTPVLVLQGRFHLYEGYAPRQVCFGIRTLGELGIGRLLLTNAAGALNPLFSTGSLMVISDHLNMTGHNPLTGPNVDDWGPRFPDMSSVYAPALQQTLLREGSTLGLRLERGVYVGVSGPSMETPAETRALKRLGGDAVGMSTVLEAVAAHHMGMEVAGISCLTNKNLPDCLEPTSLEDVIAQAEHAGRDLGRLLDRAVPLKGAAR